MGGLTADCHQRGKGDDIITQVAAPFPGALLSARSTLLSVFPSSHLTPMSPAKYPIRPLAVFISLQFGDNRDIPVGEIDAGNCGTETCPTPTCAGETGVR